MSKRTSHKDRVARAVAQNRADVPGEGPLVGRHRAQRTIVVPVLVQIDPDVAGKPHGAGPSDDV